MVQTTVKNLPRNLDLFRGSIARLKVSLIGNSYLAKFQKRAVPNLKNYSTKNDENLQKLKAGQ